MSPGDGRDLLDCRISRKRVKGIFQSLPFSDCAARVFGKSIGFEDYPPGQFGLVDATPLCQCIQKRRSRSVWV